MAKNKLSDEQLETIMDQVETELVGWADLD
jgi:hypothetical protein